MFGWPKEKNRSTNPSANIGIGLLVNGKELGSEVPILYHVGVVQGSVVGCHILIIAFVGFSSGSQPVNNSGLDIQVRLCSKH